MKSRWDELDNDQRKLLGLMDEDGRTSVGSFQVMVPIEELLRKADNLEVKLPGVQAATQWLQDNAAPIQVGLQTVIEGIIASMMVATLEPLRAAPAQDPSDQPTTPSA
jgi:hypothetical protein